MDHSVEKIAQKVISTIEQKLDDELQALDQLDGSGLEALREQRLQEMKKEAELKNEWRAKGHGEYTEIEEREFFSICRNSPEIVVHFYKRDVPRSKIFDHHLKILAPKHLEARFVKINAENATFLAERLRIKIIPTLLIAIGGKTKDYIVGFSDLGNRDDFSTEVLEWRLGVSGVIKYDGDLSQPPERSQKKSKVARIHKRTIREVSSSEDSD